MNKVLAPSPCSDPVADAASCVQRVPVVWLSFCGQVGPASLCQLVASSTSHFCQRALHCDVETSASYDLRCLPAHRHNLSRTDRVLVTEAPSAAPVGPPSLDFLEFQPPAAEVEHGREAASPAQVRARPFLGGL